ncbi:MAG: 50S ribosomal protein L11 methyltransferase [Candidatus Omnitrophica bacterium]|nr:50S ribosomal protein L11 methyltransferase [Candidatus Omnitrophota bacterium]
MTSKNLYENRFIFSSGAPDKAELLRGLLKLYGVEEQEIVEVNQNGKTEISLFTGSKRRAFFLKEKMACLFHSGISVSVKSLKTSDWQTRWKQDFKTFALTRNLSIVPAWEKKSWKKGKTEPLFIDTDTVFGTGMHPTTRFMAGFIESKRGQFNDFLDIGTGTGILSLVAWKNGCKQIWCLDISREAVQVAKRNFQNNQCRPKFIRAMDFTKFKTLKKFDFVAANVLSFDLIRMKDSIISRVRPGKFLAVSGIYLKNFPMFRKRFAGPQLRCLTTVKKDGWAAVLYTREKGAENE